MTHDEEIKTTRILNKIAACAVVICAVMAGCLSLHVGMLGAAIGWFFIGACFVPGATKVS
jgi:hypothetical protein